MQGSSVRTDRGFSVIELLVVLGITGVLSAMAGLQIMMARPSIKGDGAMRVILGQMRTAREMAITERRYMRVTFVSPNLMQIVREEAPGPSTTLVDSRVLEGNIQFLLIGGVGDTPDAFGQTSAVSFGTATNVKFTPEGTMVDQNGRTINGSVFLAMPSEPLSVRAVTVLGSTGRIRGYRWDGRAWRLV
jgi:prepilin-type N-terminal cleavage/methylation domain-containing protein